MSILTVKIFAGLLQLHGPGATIQSDHPGIDALLPDMREQSSDKGTVSDQDASGMTASEEFLSDQPVVTEAYFRRGFVRAPYAGGAFRRGGAVGPYGGFRRGGFVRGY
jgi:hypothetical protein